MHPPTGVFMSASFCKLPSVEIMTIELMATLMLRHYKGELLDRWILVEDLVWEEGVYRSAQQCKVKWKKLTRGCKKVLDYEKDIPSGRDSYWHMTRKIENIPRCLLISTDRSMRLSWNGMAECEQ